MHKNTGKTSLVFLLPILLLIALLFSPILVYADSDNYVSGNSESVSVHVEGQKTKKDVNGKENHVYSIPVPGGGWTDDNAVKSEEFSFSIIPSENNPAGAAGIPAKVKTKEGGALDFGVWTFTRQGSYSYTVSEDYARGWKHPADISVTVVVSKDSKGMFRAQVSFSNGEGLLFVNEYGSDTPKDEPVPGALPLDGTKILLSGGEKTGVKEGQFSFILTADRNNASDGFSLPENLKAYNKADGTFSFDEIEFSKAGQYVFYISEETGTQKGYSYDTSLYTAFVSVTLNEENELVPTVSAILRNGETAEEIEFVNQYDEEAPEAHINLTGLKKIEGDYPAEDIREGDFEFTVKSDVSNDSSGYSGVSEKVYVKDGGDIDFGKWSFTKEGTYIFTIKETEGTKSGFIYDSSEIEVTVKVSYLESSDRLYTSVAFAKDGREITEDVPITFTNKYTPSETPTPSVTPSVTPTPTPSVTPSVTPTPTPSVTPSVTPTPTPSMTPSVTPTPTPSVTPSVTPTPYTTPPGRNVTPPPGSSWKSAVKTGDETNPALWIILAAAAACAAVMLEKKRRKK